MDDPGRSASPLTFARIFWLWVPLAASWALMTVEYPIIQAAIARLPDAEVMLAAASLLIGLQITIESPVIMLLATTTALAKGPESYRVLRRFMIHLNVGCTVVAALVAFVDPLYDGLVRTLLGIPDRIAAEARPGFVVMILWSAAIGWRRFYQGALIRAGRTRRVGAGTLVRLLFAAGTAIVLTLRGGMSGLVVGASAWMAGVLAEAFFVHWLARSVVRERYGPDVAPERAPPTYGDVVRYHAPLAATTLLSLLAMPVLQAGISRMPDPEANLAAWPVVFAVLLLFRSPGFALPEVVIAAMTRPSSVAPLRRFARLVAAGVVVLLSLFAISPLLPVYLGAALDVPRHLVPLVLPGILAGLLIPGLQALQSWFRGVLMTARQTSHVYWGMGIALLTTTVAVVAAALLQTGGVVSAVLALAVGMVLESVYLARRSRAALGALRYEDPDSSTGVVAQRRS